MLESRSGNGKLDAPLQPWRSGHETPAHARVARALSPVIYSKKGLQFRHDMGAEEPHPLSKLCEHGFYT